MLGWTVMVVAKVTRDVIEMCCVCYDNQACVLLLYITFHSFHLILSITIQENKTALEKTGKKRVCWNYPIKSCTGSTQFNKFFNITFFKSQEKFNKLN